MDHNEPDGSTIQRRADTAVAAGPTLSTTSIALCAAGAVCLLLAVGAAGYAYRRYRRSRASSNTFKAKISEPELRAAPKHALVGPSILIKSPTDFGRVSSSKPSTPDSAIDAALGLNQKGNRFTASDDDWLGTRGGAAAVAAQNAAVPGPSRPPRAKVARTAGPRAPSSSPPATGSGAAKSGRGAVPSLLIRSLGDLPQTQTTLQAGPTVPLDEAPTGSASLKAPDAGTSNDEDDDVSLTPILNLDFTFSEDGKGDTSAVALEDQLDFEIERTRWMSSALSTAYEGRMSIKSSSRAPSRTSMASASPPKPVPRELPPLTPTRSRAQSVARSDATGADSKPASIYYSASSASGSLASSQSAKSNKAFTAIAMPDLPTQPPNQPAFGSGASTGSGFLPAPTFRPLSLGLAFGKSTSQTSLGSAVFGNMSGLWAERSDDANTSASDLESGLSESHAMSRDWSSGGFSHTSSNTSLGSDAQNTSIAKATVVPAASLPPLPPFPRHLKKPVDVKAVSPSNSPASKLAVLPSPSQAPAPEIQPTSAPAPAPVAEPVSESSLEREAEPATELTAEPIAPAFTPMRKRASTFGSSGELSAILRKDQLATSSVAPAVPSTAEAPSTGSLQINTVHANASAISLPMALSEAKQALLRAGPQLPFMSPYHHAVFPDPPSHTGRRSLDDQGRIPLQVQLAAMASPVLAGSPKPKFSESLKARLSLSRKSLSGSPILGGPKEGSPRLPQLDQSPKPSSAGVPFPSSQGRADVASSPTLTGFFRPLRSLSRPSTAEEKQRIARSPLSSSDPLPATSVAQAVAIVVAEAASIKSPASDGKGPVRSEAGDHVSPIMQPGRWAEGVPQSLADDNLTPRRPPRPELHRIDLSALKGLPLSTSTSSTATTSPLDEIEARISMHIDGPVKTDETEVPTRTNFDCENIAMEVVDEERNAVHSRSASEVSLGTAPSSVRMSVASSVAASAAETMSIVSSCATDSVSGEFDESAAASRRAKLLASVKQNLAKDLAKDREATQTALSSNALHDMSASLSDEPNNFGLGLYSAEPEEEEGAAEVEVEEDGDVSASATALGGQPHRGPRSLLLSRGSQHKPLALNLVDRHAKLEHDAMAPLTPPYTPIHSHMLPAGGAVQRHFESTATAAAAAAAAQQTGRRKLELVSSIGAGARPGVVPTGRSRSHADIAAAKDAFAGPRTTGTRLSPLTGSPSTPSLPTFASGTDTPLLHAGYGTGSAKLRPLSLASSSTVVGGGAANSSEAGTPILRKLAERAAFSPALNTASALSSPNPSYVGRPSLDRASRRFSRCGPPAKGGVLPTVNSSGALQTGRAYHAEIASSTSKDSMLMSSSNNSFASLSNGTCTSSPARPSFKSLYGGVGAAEAIRPPSLVATRRAPQPPMGDAIAEVRTSSDEVLADVLNHVDLASAIGI
ncbi:uncharacterized protein PFL1_03420 [Pseudozyma flocculosa PF-1]|uniref:Uncharacterized protein n=2 Tax=Pseudozyma flocculosa TaxID=84751 RepID=A0A5C3F6Q5_9BASI|nr:uncharacterized protein PFL1_03420 [Pseudozyma flocculosa PF-1]EPQ29132.1 hypothetical protein PFL1_03420 [Pseudozyma flocculosa PF-1]SPO40128.1 uncharacterized protein PSFLO_05610 [Pseudozyma flocculosa]